MPYQLIESQAQLEDYLASIDDRSPVSVDTEFFRETTYYPKLGLVQLASNGNIALVDPLAFDATAGLSSLLLDSNRHKLFHSCSQDLEVLLQYLGELPCPVYDSQIAASMVSDRDQVSYARLVADHLSVELEKSQTRTNWLKRPLSKKQLVYAAEDVEYLADVFDRLLEALENSGRMNWFEQDCQLLCASTDRFQPDFDRCWTRVKGTQKMNPEQLAIIDALARWREQLAIKLDLTRKQVVSDDALVAAAIERPADSRQLTANGRWHRSLNDGDYEQALQEIENALARDPDSWPRHTRFQQSNEQRSLIKRMMAELEAAAGELGIAQSVLGSRKEIEKLVTGKRDSAMLSGWRGELLTERLLNLLEA